MISFLPKKNFNFSHFQKLLTPSVESNQLTNNGPLVRELEKTAHQMLKLEDDYAVVATCNGTGALQAIFYAFERANKNPLSKCVQSFTFDSTAQGALNGATIVDFDQDYDVDIGQEIPFMYSNVVVITNVFGHVQNIDKILDILNQNEKIIIFDNAATPYSFVDGINSCCLVDASMVSLHHTKPIGYGEGGLAIVKKELEDDIREIINFGKFDGKFNERGSNWKMSDIAAAGILQYWNSFDIDELSKLYRDNYYNLRYKLTLEHGGEPLPNHSDDENFFPSNLPYIFKIPVETNMFEDIETKKYYKPISDVTPIAVELYQKVLNFPLYCKYDI